jgi:DMSO/TMAO reductase YedYZ heme-binding membrane subunit
VTADGGGNAVGSNDDVERKLTTQWKDVRNLAFGVWLALSPWVLSHASQSTPAWDAQTVGVIIAVAALAAWSPSRRRRSGSSFRVAGEPP